MARFSFAFLVIAFSFVGISNVQACESACRGDPVKFLSNHYSAVLDRQAGKLNPDDAKLSRKLNHKVVSKLVGRGKVIDETIFDKFRGPCANDPGKRAPEEFCGSAKAIACFAPWGHKDSVLDMVHKSVVDTIRKVYDDESKQIKEVMIDSVKDFCPDNCQDWVEPFQQIMLVWEQREHPAQYKVTPNCLPLGKGGI
ncbi:hypothetical protein BGZ76_007841 [Entomortierella beljakovae]|nr:hypothetical protein BGZ76_007841 [Entomortierella beljakovae]